MKLLDRVAEEMQEDMMRMRQATAQVMASQKQLSAKQRSMQDDLAREALRRRKVLQEDADRMSEQVTLQTQALEQLQGKLGEARSKKDTLKARAASAKTSLALQEMIGGLQVRSGSSWAAFDKMEEKVAALEAQAQSAAALAAPDSLERQFAALEGDGGVDADTLPLGTAVRCGPVEAQLGNDKGVSITGNAVSQALPYCFLHPRMCVGNSVVLLLQMQARHESASLW
eukprot:XP_001699493.1 predicted protein [Chlamydomonas reinhardtii]